jgi:rod shape-determining protein MreD
MKRILFFLFLGVFFLILQTTWLASLPIRKIRPDLVLILTLYLGFSFPPVSGGMLSFFLGSLMDLFSGNSFGLYAFSRPLLFCGVQLFKDRIYLESFFSRSLFVFFFALMEGILLLILLEALNPEPLRNLYRAFVPFFLFQSLSTALVSPVLFSFFKKGFSWVHGQPRPGMGERVSP